MTPPTNPGVKFNILGLTIDPIGLVWDYKGQVLDTSTPEVSLVLDLNRVITASWAHNLCKSVLDTINCKSS